MSKSGSESVMHSSELHISRARELDLNDILEIEQLSFDNPRSRHWLLMHINSGMTTIVARTRNGEVVGFAVYDKRPGLVVLVDLAVHPSCRRRGVGSVLVGRIARKMEPTKRSRVLAYVRETNLDCQLMLKSLGFKASEVVDRCFPDTGEDAYAMELTYVGAMERGLPVAIAR